jgi:hypothetical protein
MQPPDICVIADITVLNTNKQGAEDEISDPE